MSKKVFSDSNINWKPDNPQEMLKSNFYFSGLLAAEMSCSIIKATNKNPKGYYFALDLTVSNADRKLLTEVNRVVMNGRGIITPVKGAYNLSARGREKVRETLNFLKTYPILVGDLAKNRITLLETALAYLDKYRTHQFQKDKNVKMEKLRKRFREIKERGIVDLKFGLPKVPKVDREFLGYFFAGVIDGEGSFGVKSSRFTQEPFFAIAMKDRRIIESLREFVGYGNVRLRKDGVYHLEINSREFLKKICGMFLNQFPLRHEGQKNRLLKLQQLLNDYTPSPALRGDDIV
ncbi:MAG: LAGLIDADG family homing endonuclease [Candidatus Taylorbacteria bacterium]|nr:LAGLIDADG family homing endonuclease [Candidatus Taylorbacteria bacterium]